MAMIGVDGGISNELSPKHGRGYFSESIQIERYPSSELEILDKFETLLLLIMTYVSRACVKNEISKSQINCTAAKFFNFRSYIHIRKQ
jgi:hypothetical protein